MNDRLNYSESPWAISKGEGSFDETVITSENDINVATIIGIGSFKKEVEANAKIVAGSPLMYEAIDRAIFYIDNDMTKSARATLEEAFKKVNNLKIKTNGKK